MKFGGLKNFGFKDLDAWYYLIGICESTQGVFECMRETICEEDK